MNHTISTDMLEGFEYVSTIASSTNNGKPKRLEIQNKLFYGAIVSTFRVVSNNIVVMTSEFLSETIEVYNSL